MWVKPEWLRSKAPPRIEQGFVIKPALLFDFILHPVLQQGLIKGYFFPGKMAITHAFSFGLDIS